MYSSNWMRCKCKKCYDRDYYIVSQIPRGCYRCGGELEPNERTNFTYSEGTIIGLLMLTILLWCLFNL